MLCILTKLYILGWFILTGNLLEKQTQPKKFQRQTQERFDKDNMYDSGCWIVLN